MSLCKKCNQPKEMYYGQWCPRCEKPEVVITKSLNMIMMLRYLDIKRPGIKKRLWESWADAYEFRNDTSVYIYTEESDLEDLDQDIQDDYRFMWKEFPETKDGMLFDVSW